MFCIFSKSKNGNDQPIVYFDTYEKAQSSMPADATDWYIKDIGDLKTFINTYRKNQPAKKYITTKSISSSNIKEEKIDLYDANDDLRTHALKAIIKTATDDIIPDEFDKRLEKRPILTPKKITATPKSRESFHYNKNNKIQKHEPPLKTYHLNPIEEDGKNVFRYSFFFYEETSIPKITKTFESNEEKDTFRKICFLKGYIYPNKGFSIIVYEHKQEEAEKLMKEKLKSLKKDFRGK